MRGGRQRARTIILIPLILLIILGLRPLVQHNNGGIGKFLNGVFGEQVVPWKAVNAFSEKLPLPLWVIPKIDSSGYLYTDRVGQIWEIDSTRNDPDPRLVLDISKQVYALGDGGLMDIAYHPEFGIQGSPNNRFIYVNYIYIPQELKPQNPDQLAYHRLSRFTVQESGLINPDSELVFIQMFDRNHLHSGGSIFFDNEGFLNISFGDEGKHNDLFFNANTLEKRLFAGIIRIDVDMDPSISHPPRRKPIDVERPEGWPADFYENYYIPNTNPWLSPSGGFLEEFVIVGLRNPHTTYYDAIKDEIWVADVGEATREEVSLMKRGDNGQWPFMEGTIPGPRERPAEIFGTERPPIHDFGRDIGRSVIGGFVYRGEYESLNEHFIFGDFATKNVWALNPANGVVQFLTNTDNNRGRPFGPVSFVNGVNNEIFVVDYGTRSILELIPNDQVSERLAPNLLSEVGAFEDLDLLQTSEGIIPYALNSELYSDGAQKQRWVAIPNDGQFDTLSEQVAVNERGELAFPRGTVFIKHFELPFDMRSPELTRKLETRFLVITDNLDAYGLTYRWNEDGSDAELLEAGAEATYEIIDQQGELSQVNWTFPSRQQCMTCHTANAGYVLGPNMHNLNRSLSYQEDEAPINQLRHWQNQSIFHETLELSDYTPLNALDQDFVSNEVKVRSYLQTNCSFCHRPGGVETNFNALFTATLDSANLIGAATVGRQSEEENSVIAPGDILHSEMVRRIESLEGIRMPPLGTSLVDQEFAATLKDWILELDQVTAASAPGEVPSFSIYPNPVSGHTLHIQAKSPDKLYGLTVYTLSGALVYHENQVSFNAPLNVPLERGVYFVRIVDGNKLTTMKLVKE